MQYYNLALQCAPEQAVEIKRECFDALADICIENGEFAECIEHGEKGYNVKPVKNEVGCLHFSQWFLICKHFASYHRQVLGMYVQIKLSLTTAITQLT